MKTQYQNTKQKTKKNTNETNTIQYNTITHTFLDTSVMLKTNQIKKQSDEYIKQSQNAHRVSLYLSVRTSGKSLVDRQTRKSKNDPEGMTAAVGE